VQQDCYVYSTLMHSGRHLVHQLASNRTACLLVVDGEIQLDELRLRTGDMALVRDEVAVSFLAKSDSDVLLVDSLHAPSNSNGSPE
jgi:hypothetical protein